MRRTIDGAQLQYSASISHYPGVRTLLAGAALFLLVTFLAVTGIVGKVVIDGTAPNRILSVGISLAALLAAAGLLRIDVEVRRRTARGDEPMP